MTHAVWNFGLPSSLAVALTLCAAPAAPQVEATSTTTSTAAYVYIQIQGPEGAVYGFRASSSGHLSTIPGSPFKPAGEIIGGTQTKFFTLGKTLIHSYGIASDGAIGSQLSQIAFFDYSGGECGPSTSVQQGAVLDHTGKYIYVLLWCGGGYVAPYEYRYQSAEYQTYLIHSDGAFSYDGDADLPADSDGYVGYLPSILGDESFAYGGWADQHSALVGLRRTSAGTLESMNFTESNPTPIEEEYFVDGPDASPTGNYLVLQLYPGKETSTAQFGSYTVASNGDISTTNTWSNMPVTSLRYGPRSTFSPSGDLFVAYGGNDAIGANGNGIELYRFNRAAPLTLYRTLLRGTRIDDVKWDGSGHLYAISTASNILYVFKVTAKSVTEDSSWSIGSPSKMVVISK